MSSIKLREKVLDMRDCSKRVRKNIGKKIVELAHQNKVLSERLHELNEIKDFSEAILISGEDPFLQSKKSTLCLLE